MLKYAEINILDITVEHLNITIEHLDGCPIVKYPFFSVCRFEEKFAYVSTLEFISVLILSWKWLYQFIL